MRGSVVLASRGDAQVYSSRQVQDPSLTEQDLDGDPTPSLQVPVFAMEGLGVDAERLGKTRELRAREAASSVGRCDSVSAVRKMGTSKNHSKPSALSKKDAVGFLLLIESTNSLLEVGKCAAGTGEEVGVACLF